MKATKIVSIVCLLVLLFVTESAFARYDHFSSIYNKYKDRDAVFAMSFSPGSFGSLFKDGDKDMNEVIKKINEIKMLTYENKPELIASFKEDMKKCFKAEHYEDLLVMNDGKSNVSLKAIKENGKITELVILVNDTNSLTVIYINGEIDTKNAQKLANNFSASKTNK